MRDLDIVKKVVAFWNENHEAAADFLESQRVSGAAELVLNPAITKMLDKMEPIKVSRHDNCACDVQGVIFETCIGYEKRLAVTVDGSVLQIEEYSDRNGSNQTVKTYK